MSTAAEPVPVPEQNTAQGGTGAKFAIFLKAAGRKTLDFVLQYWFILGVGLAIGIAAAVPNLGKNGGWIAAQYTIKYGAVIIIFLLSGLSLKTRVLLNATRRLHLHLFIQLLCLGLTPVIGYGVAEAMRTAPWINQDLVSGLIVCTSMPTTVSTNVVFTRQAGGSEAEALINAVIGNVIGIFVSPSLLLLYLGENSSAPFGKVLSNLGITVIAPLVAGQIIQFFLPKPVAWLQSKINFGNVSNFCIILLVWNTFSGFFASPVTADGGSLALVIVMCVVLYPVFSVLCFGLARLIATQRLLQRLFKISRPDTVAIVMCGATKTIALGMPLINVLYGGQTNAALLALPLIVYHASQVLQGNLLIRPLKAWVQAGSELPVKAGDAGSGGSGSAGGNGGGPEGMPGSTLADEKDGPSTSGSPASSVAGNPDEDMSVPDSTEKQRTAVGEGTEGDHGHDAGGPGYGGVNQTALRLGPGVNALAQAGVRGCGAGGRRRRHHDFPLRPSRDGPVSTLNPVFELPDMVEGDGLSPEDAACSIRMHSIADAPHAGPSVYVSASEAPARPAGCGDQAHGCSSSALSAVPTPRVVSV